MRNSVANHYFRDFCNAQAFTNVEAPGGTRLSQDFYRPLSANPPWRPIGRQIIFLHASLSARELRAQPPPVVRASRESPTLSPTLSPTDDTPAHARDVNPPWPFRACPARCDRRSATTPGDDTRARRRRRRARARTRWCTVRAIPTTRMTGPLSTGRRPAPASLVRPPRCPSPTVQPDRPPPRSRARSTPVCRPSRRVVIARGARPDHPNLPTFRTAPDTTRTPPRTYLPLDTQARLGFSPRGSVTSSPSRSRAVDASASGSAPISRSMSEYHAATVVQSSWRGFKAREGAREKRALVASDIASAAGEKNARKTRAPPPPTSPLRYPGVLASRAGSTAGPSAWSCGTCTSSAACFCTSAS